MFSARCVHNLRYLLRHPPSVTTSIRPSIPPEDALRLVDGLLFFHTSITHKDIVYMISYTSSYTIQIQHSNSPFESVHKHHCHIVLRLFSLSVWISGRHRRLVASPRASSTVNVAGARFTRDLQAFLRLPLGRESSALPSSNATVELMCDRPTIEVILGSTSRRALRAAESKGAGSGRGPQAARVRLQPQVLLQSALRCLPLRGASV